MTEPPDLNRLAAEVRSAVLAEFTADSCIASTLAVIETCRYFGVKARPQPTTIRAYSGLAWQQRETLADTDPADWPRGAYSVGIDGVAPSKPGRWNGHLVAVTDTHLVDASLDQFARPRHGLNVVATAFRLDAGGWPDGEPVAFARPDGTVIIYERLRSGDWRRSANWRRSLPAMRRVVGEAIRALR